MDQHAAPCTVQNEDHQPNYDDVETDDEESWILQNCVQVNPTEGAIKNTVLHESDVENSKDGKDDGFRVQHTIVDGKKHDNDGDNQKTDSKTDSNDMDNRENVDKTIVESSVLLKSKEYDEGSNVVIRQEQNRDEDSRSVSSSENLVDIETNDDEGVRLQPDVGSPMEGEFAEDDKNLVNLLSGMSTLANLCMEVITLSNSSDTASTSTVVGSNDEPLHDSQSSAALQSYKTDPDSPETEVFSVEVNYNADNPKKPEITEMDNSLSVQPDRAFLINSLALSSSQSPIDVDDCPSPRNDSPNNPTEKENIQPVEVDSTISLGDCEDSL